MTVTSTDGSERAFRCGTCDTEFTKVMMTGIDQDGNEVTDTHYRQACDCNPCPVKMDPEKCEDCGNVLEPGTVHVNCRRRIDLLEMRHPAEFKQITAWKWNPPVAKRRKH